MNMVDKIAGAICRANDDVISEDCSQQPCDPCKRKARAALEAMREPTEAMMDAGQMADRDGDAGNADDVFEAMVDAALTEGEDND